ncbi:MAG: lysophospholipid acyltransferase family protein [Verrucomicrobia bacterium]|nr:lysophospholipid acyltransferase family protein [Verrucomicrobiota bacterium]
MKRLRNALWSALLALAVRVIPRWERPKLLRVARVLGRLGYALAFHQRRVALANSRIVFGQPRPDLVKKSFQIFALTVLEIVWSRRLDATTIQDVVEVDPAGLELARALVARGKGGIAINLHFSNWEMMGLACAYCGLKINYIAVPTGNPRMDETLNAHRLAAGLKIIWRRGAGPKLLRAIKRGECISMMMDINVKPTDGGIWVNFCGLPVCVSSLTVMLAQRTGAPMQPVYCVSLPGGRYRVLFGPEITCTPGDDPRAVAQRIMDFAEDALRRHPEDWWWVYKRWKYRPPGATQAFPFYSKPAGEDRHAPKTGAVEAAE